MVKPLTYAQWREAMEVFSECYKRCMLRRHIDEKMEIKHWLDTLATTTPVYLFRPDSLEILQEQIFSKMAIHGFVLDLHFFFLASRLETRIQAPPAARSNEGARAAGGYAEPGADR